jgi:hypothetical protein
MSSPQRRLEFQLLLEATLGSNYVYFQPPDNATIEYPCIVYERDKASTKHAGNLPYSFKQCYQVTYIAQHPDSDTLDKLAAYPLSSFSRHFATSGLNHDVFEIYH